MYEVRTSINHFPLQIARVVACPYTAVNDETNRHACTAAAPRPFSYTLTQASRVLSTRRGRGHMDVISLQMQVQTLKWSQRAVRGPSAVNQLSQLSTTNVPTVIGLRFYGTCTECSNFSSFCKPHRGKPALQRTADAQGFNWMREISSDSNARRDFRLLIILIVSSSESRPPIYSTQVHSF